MGKKLFSGFKTLFSVILVIAILVVMVGCGAGEGSSTPKDNSGSSSNTSSVSSELSPIAVFFPESYTKFLPLKENEQPISIKGLTGIEVSKNHIMHFDSSSYEGVKYDYGATTLSGVGVGSDIDAFCEVYGINESNSLNNEGSIWAVLLLDDNGNITYLEKDGVFEAVRALAESGKVYAEYKEFPFNILTVVVNTKDNKTVDSFKIVHYVY